MPSGLPVQVRPWAPSFEKPDSYCLHNFYSRNFGLDDGFFTRLLVPVPHRYHYLDKFPLIILRTILFSSCLKGVTCSPIWRTDASTYLPQCWHGVSHQSIRCGETYDEVVRSGLGGKTLLYSHQPSPNPLVFMCKYFFHPLPSLPLPKWATKHSCLHLCLQRIMVAPYLLFWALRWPPHSTTLLPLGLVTIGVNFNSPLFSMAVGVLFIGIGLWLLKPDKHDFISNKFLRYSPFVASFIAFFLAEIGDKTQIATIALASEYQALIWVTLGTTIGMLIANIPAVFLGEAFIAKIPMQHVRNLASIAFIGFGAFQLIQSI